VVNMESIKRQIALAKDITPYRRREINLTAESIDVEIKEAGSLIYVEKADGDAYIRLNRLDCDKILLTEGLTIKAPFERLYLSNAAQAGKEIHLLVGIADFFRPSLRGILNHAKLKNVLPDQHHAQLHTLLSHTTRPHADLTDILPDVHGDIKIRSKVVDEANLANDRILVYKSATDNLVYEDKPVAAPPNQLRQTFISAQALNANRFVYPSSLLATLGKVLEAPAGYDRRVVGVSLNAAAAADESVEVAIAGVVEVLAAEKLSVGEGVKTTAGGKAAKLTYGHLHKIGTTTGTAAVPAEDQIVESYNADGTLSTDTTIRWGVATAGQAARSIYTDSKALATCGQALEAGGADILTKIIVRPAAV